jgi:large subunit ribosomal protein L35
MPKMKSKSAVKKRFQLTATGKLKRHRTNAAHLLTKKSSKRKQRLRQATVVSHASGQRIRRFLAV